MRVRAVVAGVLALGLLVSGGGSAAASTMERSASPSTARMPARSAVADAGLGALGRLGPLTDLMIDRLNVGDEVAVAKFGTGRPIDDPVREQQLLDQVRGDAVALGLEPEATVRIFRDQIEANKVVQRGLFARWTAHPDEAPTVRPDLVQLRIRLDRLTTAIIAELVRTERLRDSGIGCRVHLALATTSGRITRHLDSLHRTALARAVLSICT